MKNKGWMIFQILQLVIFLSMSLFLFLRGIDGHDTIQTLEIKFFSFAVWTVFYLGLLIVEWLIYILVKRK